MLNQQTDLLKKIVDELSQLLQEVKALRECQSESLLEMKKHTRETAQAIRLHFSALRRCEWVMV